MPLTRAPVRLLALGLLGVMACRPPAAEGHRAPLAKAIPLERRLGELSALRAKLGSELPLAKQALEGMPERIEALQAEYQGTLEKLLAALEQPLVAAPAPGAGAAPRVNLGR